MVRTLHPVQVLLPVSATVARESGNVVETQATNGFRNLLGSAGGFRLQHTSDALEEETTVNQDGYLSLASAEKKKPQGFCTLPG